MLKSVRCCADEQERMLQADEPMDAAVDDPESRSRVPRILDVEERDVMRRIDKYPIFGHFFCFLLLFFQLLFYALLLCCQFLVDFTLKALLVLLFLYFQGFL